MYFVLFATGMVVVVVLLIVRELRKARAVGMSQNQPACGHCKYLLGGWSASTCPECGSDVCTVGVLTGSQHLRAIADAGVLVMALVVVGPLAMKGMNWIFAQHGVSAYTLLTSKMIPGMSMRLGTESRWQRFPPGCYFTTTLNFTRLLNSHKGGAFMNGRLVGSSPLTTKSLEFNQTTGLPDRATLKEAIAFVAGEKADTETIEQQIDTVETMLTTIHQAQCNGKFRTRMLMSYSSPLWQKSSAGGHDHHLMHWLGFVSTGIVVIVFYITGVMAVGRWCMLGWRLPQEGEWGWIRIAGDQERERVELDDV